MPQKTRLEILAEMVTGYSSARHEKQMLPIGHPRFAWHARFRRLSPSSWAIPEDIPYVAATSLLDAYWQLPRRPDLAFNSLWSATNSSYNDLFLASPQNAASAKLTDKMSIDFSLKEIAARLNLMVPTSSPAMAPAQGISIRDLIKMYLKNAHDRNFHFVAQYILRGIAVEEHNANKVPPKAAIRDILVPASYLSFKKEFGSIHAKIKASLGGKYATLCTITESACGTEINFGIQDSKKARGIVHQASLLLRQEALNPSMTNGGVAGTFSSDQHWLSFVVRPLLYASRNNAAHGNVASRLNSLSASANSVTAATWTFLFCYLYFSLILLCQAKITLADLEPLYENADLV
ncbi:hypothetical protein [Stenotrophomonas beteli]|uniref:Uncharacterized protein n=1 Tax=Stenotrophomonas beteli TaxID=3384461 RepID=A0A0R0B2X2_9GAMM|nr:hypothetical protein [Stenotrophomonas maltophilia]KRG51574.1 hypothetical protein ARC23_00710 [Stenotrophomonas maltophilia]